MLVPATLLEYLREQGIAITLYHHPRLAHAGDLAAVPPMRGEILKNLVLKNRRGELFLFTLPLMERADLKALARALGSPRLSFTGNDDLVWMGIPPGMVSPLSLLNDRGQRLRLVLPEEIRNFELVNCHPLDNTMSIDIRLDELLALLARHGHQAEYYPGVLVRDAP